MDDYKALGQEAREFAQAHRVMGELFTADRYTRLADAVEALVADNTELRGTQCDATHTTLRTLQAERDEAVKQLSESRARFGDMESRVVELEALVAQLRDEAKAIVDTTRVNGTDFERGQEHVAERVFDWLSVHPSVVLADHDAAVWDDGFTACAHEHMNQDRDPTYPIHRPNPYRGDNR